MSLFHKVINFIENNLLYTNSAIKCVTICTPPQKKLILILTSCLTLVHRPT